MSLQWLETGICLQKIEQASCLQTAVCWGNIGNIKIAINLSEKNHCVLLKYIDIINSRV